MNTRATYLFLGQHFSTPVLSETFKKWWFGLCPGNFFCPRGRHPHLQSPSLLWRSTSKSIFAKRTRLSFFSTLTENIEAFFLSLYKQTSISYIIVYKKKKNLLQIFFLNFHKRSVFSGLFSKGKRALFRISDKLLLSEPHSYL